MLYERDVNINQLNYENNSLKQELESFNEFKVKLEIIPSLETKFKTLFQNQKGENLTGEDVVKNLRFKKYDSDVSAKNLEDALFQIEEWANSDICVGYSRSQFA